MYREHMPKKNSYDLAWPTGKEAAEAQRPSSAECSGGKAGGAAGAAEDATMAVMRSMAR